VSHSLDWSEAALNAAAGFLSDDPVGLGQLIDALDDLTRDPAPARSSSLIEGGLRRLRVGRYRTLYEIAESTTISIIHIGRLG
jgi:mRNA interferase RelE/StbE